MTGSGNNTVFTTVIGDQSRVKNFKWEYVDPNSLVVGRAEGHRQTSEPSEDSELSGEQMQNIQNVDSIKFVLVTVALIGVLCGAAFVYFTEEELLHHDEGSSNEVVISEPLKYYEDNSYLGGIIRLVKVNGTNKLDPSERENQTVSIEIPELLHSLVSSYLASFYERFLEFLSGFFWNEPSQCSINN